MVQNKGQGGNGQITVTINAGSTVQGGTGIGAGLVMLDGTSNQFNNNGTVLAAEPLAGWAIDATGGTLTASPTLASVAGSVRLGAGSNVFLNEASATLASGELIALGDGGVLTNRGTLSPGGGGEQASTRLEGDLPQTSSGRLIVDVDARQTRNDSVTVEGSADLAGNVRVIVGDAGRADNPQRVTIVEAETASPPPLPSTSTRPLPRSAVTASCSAIRRRST